MEQPGVDSFQIVHERVPESIAVLQTDADLSTYTGGLLGGNPFSEGERHMRSIVFVLGIIVLIAFVAVVSFWIGSNYGRQQALNTRTVTRQDGVVIDLAIDPQSSLGLIADRAVMQLHADERLYSNLTDDEAKVVMDWAAQWIEEQVVLASDEPSAEQAAQNALSRVRPVITTINTVAVQSDQLRLNDAIATLAPSLNIDQGMSRAKLFKLLTTLTSSAWKIQTE